MIESFFKNYLEPCSYLIYTLVLFFKFRKDGGFKNKMLSVYYSVATILLFLASLMVIYTPVYIENNWVYNLFFLITILVLSCYFFILFWHRIKCIIVLVLLGINVLLFIIYDLLLMRFYHGFNEHVYGICYLTIVIYVFMYYDQLLRNITERNILYIFDFWLVSSYLVYFLCCAAIALYYKTFPVSERGEIWSLQNIILLISSLIAFTGFLFTRNQRSADQV